VVAVFGLGMAYRCLPEAPVGAVPILGPPQEADIQVPIACRSATVPESDCTVAWNARHHRFFRQASRPPRGLECGRAAMTDTGIIDTFLSTYTSYIDSGFGLLGGEVGFLFHADRHRRDAGRTVLGLG
jgi:hypothetical protein